MKKFQNQDFDAAMANLSPVNSVYEASQNVVKTPLSNPFLGDAILNIRIDVAVTAGSVAASLSFPVYLFAAVHYFSDYLPILQDSPSGYDLAFTEVDGNVVQTYNNADTNILTATVSSSTLKYRSILQATLTDFFKTSGIRATVTPANVAASQFAEPFKTVEKSIFGGVKQNSLDIDINVAPTNFQSNIVDISQEIVIDGKRGMVVNVNSGTTSYILNVGTSTFSKSEANF